MGEKFIMSKTVKEMQEEWLQSNKPTKCRDNMNKIYTKVNSLGQIEICCTDNSKRVRKLRKD